MPSVEEASNKKHLTGRCQGKELFNKKLPTSLDFSHMKLLTKEWENKWEIPTE